ncbi:membrane protein [Steroidobacter denitrificans]|uniref:Membrane protein n=1 Tax=Steroidobacter denitrificans TaxID=465721 RepID=A0A127F7R6_STEDE|nr:AI-2E family transporter [Steroidobacter denitrificans]AMN46482.1 membrane protein [Steroidobacter denitrificans]
MPATVQGISFAALVVLVTAAFAWLLLPFYGAVLWAVILAILFNPLQRGLVRRLGGRRTAAAAVSVLASVCVVVIPASLILASLAREAAGFYHRISTREFDPAAIVAQIHAALPAFLLEALSAIGLGDFAAIQSRLTSFLAQAAEFIATRAVSIGQSTAQLLISLGVMLYVLFFLFRDGAGLAITIRKASPLSERHTEHLMRKFAEVVKAAVKGNVIIAVMQGAIGGVTFWLLSIQAALLWGVVMAVLSLLPAVGAFLVWAPVAFYLLLSGDYLRGVTLLAVGILVISMIDNLLRPSLVGKGIRLPDYVVLVSTLGGLSLFGMNGFVIGPLIAALFVAVWSLFTDERLHDRDSDTLQVEESAQPRPAHGVPQRCIKRKMHREIGP